MTELTIEFTDSVDRETESTIRDLLTHWDVELFGTGDVRVSRLHGGANNRNFIVECSANKYALRIASALSERLAVNRVSALQAHRDAAGAGTAPNVVAWRLPEGHFLSEFREGTVLSPKNIHDPDVLHDVGMTFAQLHATSTAAADFSAFDDIRAWTATSEADGIPLSDEYRELVANADEIEALFATLPLPRVFCHNDTVPQNFIRSPQGVELVDWDYAGRGLACFELGSFACTADLSDTEVGHLLRGYGVAADEPVLARLGVMGFVAAVREIAWATMAADILTATTGMTPDWYADYLATNTARARELRRATCTTTVFAAARRVDPSDVV